MDLAEVMSQIVNFSCHRVGLFESFELPLHKVRQSRG